jgi:tetratricopeptide (TPR) repeat protein
MTKILLISCAVFCVTFLAYYNTLINDFVWDDEYLILKNSQIKSFSHFSNVFKTYVGYGSENFNNFYRPFQELSNMINYAIWKRNPMGFHLTNALLHSLVAVLVFFFVYQLSGSAPVSGLCSVLFGIHPVHTEAVAYIAGRADPLYALFFLSSLMLFVGYARLRGKKKGPLLLALSVLSFIFALLSKEISIVLPLVIVLISYVVRDDKAPLRKSWTPYFIVAAIYIALRLTVLDFSKVAPSNVTATIFMPYRLLTFFRSVIVYLGLLIFPAGLHMERTMRVTSSIVDLPSLVSLLIIAFIFVKTFGLQKRNRLASFFVFWFFINLLPMANIYPINSFIAEHWIYVASIGYFFIVSSWVCELFRKSKGRPLARSGIVICVAVASTLYFFSTVRRNRDWRDEISFFENTLHYQPNNARIHLNFGNTYFEKRMYDKAVEEYMKAIALRKNYAAAYGNMGVVYLTRKDLPRAKRSLKKALALRNDYPLAHYALGAVYYYSQEPDKAEKEFLIALQQLPQHYQSLNFLGKLYLEQGEKKKAAGVLERSLTVLPNQRLARTLLREARK